MNFGLNRSSVVGTAAILAAIVVVGAMLAMNRVEAANDSGILPDPVLNASLSSNTGEQTAVIAGGCFWGIQAVFQHVKGVKSAISGYSGGSSSTAEYEVVSMGQTGHAESVKITYDPSQISYGQLLKVFFSVAHDPTQLNRQGPDTGSQYRLVVFYANEEQKQIAEAYIAQLEQAKSFSRPIVTQVAPLKAFFPAESYHQNYATLHPDNPYIAINDAPKVEHLRQKFPELYKQ